MKTSLVRMPCVLLSRNIKLLCYFTEVAMCVKGCMWKLKRGGLCWLSIYCLSALSPYFIACSVIMELGPVNISPLPADMMLSVVSRRYCRDTGGGRGFSSGIQCASLTRLLQQGLLLSGWAPIARRGQQPPVVSSI